MEIKLDGLTTSALQQIAQQQGKTAEKLIEEMVKSQVQQQHSRVKDTPFATIYDTRSSWQARFDSDDPNLKDRVRQDVARDMMIARQRGKQPVASEVSEEQARAKYIERLTSRKSR